MDAVVGNWILFCTRPILTTLGGRVSSASAEILYPLSSKSRSNASWHAGGGSSNVLKYLNLILFDQLGNNRSK